MELMVLIVIYVTIMSADMLWRNDIQIREPVKQRLVSFTKGDRLMACANFNEGGWKRLEKEIMMYEVSAGGSLYTDINSY